MAAAATAALLAAGAPAVAVAPVHDSGGAVLNILPPGSRGNVDAVDALAAGPDRTASPDSPENFANQLEMYDAINTRVPSDIAPTE